MAWRAWALGGAVGTALGSGMVLVLLALVQ
jgi:hypothetical protein